MDGDARGRVPTIRVLGGEIGSEPAAWCRPAGRVQLPGRPLPAPVRGKEAGDFFPAVDSETGFPRRSSRESLCIEARKLSPAESREHPRGSAHDSARGEGAGPRTASSFDAGAPGG